MEKKLIVHDIIINDDPKFDESLTRAEHFVTQMVNRIDVKNYAQFKTMFNELDREINFRLWIHIGMLNNPDPKTWKGYIIKKSIDGNRKFKNLKLQFLTREPTKINEFEGMPLINIEQSVNEDFKIDKYSANNKSSLIQTFAEAKAKENTDYVGGDPFSAIEKAKKVLDVLKENGIDLTNYAFVSLGGGDGTELLYEIEKSSCKIGYMIEYEAESNDRFDKYKEPFADWVKPKVIKLKNREADLFDETKFQTLKGYIESDKLDGVIITIHAVLHELNTRSNVREEFNLETFFHRISELHKNIFLIIREPGIAENWTDKVKIKIENKKVENKKLKFIKENFPNTSAIDNDKIFNKIIEKLKEKYFRDNKHEFTFNDEKKEFFVTKDLAMEALYKFFYLQDIYYELGELQTSKSRKEIQEALVKAGFSILESEAMGTTSLKDNFKKYQIKVYEDDEKFILPRPLSFSYTIAENGSTPNAAGNHWDLN
ncbi:MAG: hypothetical protein ABI723_23335 [Bacteroidia bacterium]